MAKIAIVPISYEVLKERLPLPKEWKILWGVTEFGKDEIHLKVEADEFIDVPYGMNPPTVMVTYMDIGTGKDRRAAFKSAKYEYHKADYDYHVAMAAELKKGKADGNDAPEVLDAGGTRKGLDSNS